MSVNFLRVSKPTISEISAFHFKHYNGERLTSSKNLFLLWLLFLNHLLQVLKFVLLLGF